MNWYTTEALHFYSKLAVFMNFIFKKNVFKSRPLLINKRKCIEKRFPRILKCNECFFLPILMKTSVFYIDISRIASSVFLQQSSNQRFDVSSLMKWILQIHSSESKIVFDSLFESNRKSVILRTQSEGLRNKILRNILFFFRMKQRNTIFHTLDKLHWLL